MAKHKQLTQWQILVIDQLIEKSYELDKHKYDEGSLKALKELWSKADKVTVNFKA